MKLVFLLVLLLFLVGCVTGHVYVTPPKKYNKLSYQKRAEYIAILEKLNQMNYTNKSSGEKIIIIMEEE